MSTGSQGRRDSRTTLSRKATQLRRERVSIPLRADGSALIAAVADTHSIPHPNALSHLRALGPDAILHAGDIGALEVLARLSEVAPVYAVRGNIDSRSSAIPDVLEIEVGSTLRILMLHIAIQGPRLRADARNLADEAGADLVVCGHSHVPFIGRERGVAVFNPGSVGPRRFVLPIVFGTITLSRENLRLAHIDCETGAPWTPPTR